MFAGTGSTLTTATVGSSGGGQMTFFRASGFRTRKRFGSRLAVCAKT